MLLRGVCTLRYYLSPPNESVRWRPDGLTINAQEVVPWSQIPRSDSRFPSLLGKWCCSMSPPSSPGTSRAPRGWASPSSRAGTPNLPTDYYYNYYYHYRLLLPLLLTLLLIIISCISISSSIICITPNLPSNIIPTKIA